MENIDEINKLKENDQLKKKNKVNLSRSLDLNKELQQLTDENAELKAENEQLKSELHSKTEYMQEQRDVIEQYQNEIRMYKKCQGKRASKREAELRKALEGLKEENYQLQKDCQICENFIDFIPCKPIRDIDYDLQKVISQRDSYYHTLQEIKAIAETCMTKDACFECRYFDDYSIEDAEIPTYDICKLLIQKITKAEEE